MYKKYFLLITLLIFFTPLCYAEDAYAEDGNSIVVPSILLAEFNRLIAEQSIPGVAIGLIEQDKKKFLGLGAISFTDNTVPTANTRYEIGSISKLFNALLAQTLVDKGKLSWDDTLEDHIDGVFSSVEIAQIQLKELAIHRSGLPKLPTTRSIFRDHSDPYNGYSRNDLYDEILNRQAGNILSRSLTHSKSDKSHTYSNLGAGLLGQIAADQLKTDYDNALNKEVLQPLSMNCTSLTNHAPLAPGHNGNKVVSNWHFQALAGAGGLRSCMQDMLKYASAVLAAFENPPEQLNSKLHTSIRNTIKVHTHEPDMGLAWFVSTKEDRNIWWHNGGTGGYTSIILIEPETSRALILLVNSNLYKEVTKIGFKAMRSW